MDPPDRSGLVLDIAFVALTIACFAVVGLIARGAARL
ncbi:hypothetical protein CLV63_13746 [Murinocardiopsis flavida]|uniref:Uncharacterized protein n=1 Tax=Murinocardiopsis flavida TaxID=645275 RepID=A0A2P8CM02_9ACTN|nr:hypothetical protein CLV63_13746 [Murinocardiopsis flavida]